MSEDFKESTRKPAGSAVEPSLYQQIVDFFAENKVEMPKDFKTKLNAYHDENDNKALFSLGISFDMGDGVPHSPKFALLCYAEYIENNPNHILAAMIHFLSITNNLDKLDLSSEQKEKFQKLKGVFKEKLKEKLKEKDQKNKIKPYKYRLYKYRINLIRKYSKFLRSKAVQEYLAEMEAAIAEYEATYTPERKRKRLDPGRY